MTFKHVKFEDSPTMRSLERVAKDNGWVKEEPIVKEAARKENYKPSLALMDNIIKLCNGLRKVGMEKYADELENNFVNYKRAQTIYETSKEKGEDLVDAAHPQGSHKLEDVEGDEATVESILDIHLKMLQTVNKEPKGKLASSKDAIDAVKMVLGQQQQQPQTVPWTDQEISEDWSKYPDKWKNWVYNQMVNIMWSGMQQASSGQGVAHTFSKQYPDKLSMDVVGDIGTALQDANNAQREMRNSKDINVEGLQKMQAAFANAKQIAASEIDDQSTSNSVQNAMDQATGTIAGLIGTVRAWVSDQSKLPPGLPKPQKPVQATSSLKDQLRNRANAALAKYTYYFNHHYESIVPPAAKTKIVNFLARIESLLKDVITHSIMLRAMRILNLSKMISLET